MPVRRIAYHSPEFWERFAPYASATRMAERFPIASGGLSAPGWDNAIKKARRRWRELPWLIVPNGSRPPVFLEEDWPAPLYLDEVADTGILKSGPAAPMEDKGAPGYKETVEILADGSYRSDKLISMSENQSKDRAYLLAAHGFDADEWEIVTAKNNIWNVYSKSDDPDNPHNISTLYSSKITVRPRVCIVDSAAIAAAICAVVVPVRVTPPKRGESMLEVANTDMHFGNSTYEWYADSLERTLDVIGSQKWRQVVLLVGSDLFHCDNFKNTTSNGTQQSSVSWPEAWADALRYYGAIIEASLKHSREVHAYYVPGNHDESMTWAFCQMLAAKYPQVRFDTEIEERKVHTFGTVAVGMTHGDGRTRKDLDRVFVSEFPDFAKAAIREVHAGHYHHEMTKDQFGVVVRSLSTAARTDKWHREEGFVGAVKRFMAFEFTTDALTRIHFV